MSDPQPTHLLLWGTHLERARERLLQEKSLLVCGRASMLVTHFGALVAKGMPEGMRVLWVEAGPMLWALGQGVHDPGPVVIVADRVDRFDEGDLRQLCHLIKTYKSALWLLTSHVLLDLGPLTPHLQLRPLALIGATAYLRHRLGAGVCEGDSIESLARWSGGEAEELDRVAWACEFWGAQGALAQCEQSAPEVFKTLRKPLAVARLLGEPFELRELEESGHVTPEQTITLRRSCWIDPVEDAAPLTFTLGGLVHRWLEADDALNRTLLTQMTASSATLSHKALSTMTHEAIRLGLGEVGLELYARARQQGAHLPGALLRELMHHVLLTGSHLAHAALVVEHARFAVACGEYGEAAGSVELLEDGEFEDQVQFDLHHLRGLLARVSARPLQAIGEYDEARGLEQVDSTALGRMEMERAGALWEAGEFERAFEKLGGLLKVQRARHDRRAEGVVLSNLGVMLHHMGEPEQAKRHYLDALEIHRETGNRRFEGIALFDLSTLLFDHGTLHEARARCEASWEILKEAGDHRQALLAQMVLASLTHALGQGEFEEMWEGEINEKDVVLNEAFGLYLGLSRMHRSLEWTGPLPGECFTDEVRFPAGMIRKTRLALTHQNALVLTKGAVAFRRGAGGPAVDLSRHSAHQSILGALAHAYLSGGMPLSVEDLVQTGWPGEQISRDAAKNRVHVALSALRSLGLKGAIVYIPGAGYVLAKGLCVWLLP